ncbi:hypothetical protein [uncultured Rhodospira sp.]|uniref:HVO_A0114 family putative DNA-binding protein n=1 Tax=uncultured Rhodospira sp. TaxID=1936189 RepID=UPI00261DBD5D|nr:hypothetical protein [uncultured Rhodospira sp.]
MTDRINVHVGTPEDMGRRFVSAWERAARGEAVRETHVTVPDLEALLETLTPGRIDLLRAARRHAEATVRGLADDLHRDVVSVDGDVETLARMGLLERAGDRVIAPFAEVEARLVL